MPQETGRKPIHPGSGHPGSGHRARLRERLLAGGPDALADYELLEFLLFAAARQGDTKPTAKALIAHFGSISAVLSAEPAALKQVKGVGDAGAAALRSVSLAARRMARGRVQNAPVLGSWQALLDYLRADMAYLGVERVRVLHLNSRNMLIRDDHMGDGSIDQAAIYTREVIRRAMDLGSAALILVHNHPTWSF